MSVYRFFRMILFKLFKPAEPTKDRLQEYPGVLFYD